MLLEKFYIGLFLIDVVPRRDLVDPHADLHVD